MPTLQSHLLKLPLRQKLKEKRHAHLVTAWNSCSGFMFKTKQKENFDSSLMKCRAFFIFKWLYIFKMMSFILNTKTPDLIRNVLLAVRLIYIAGLSSCCICIMVTLGINLGHLWDACTWSQTHHGSLPVTPLQLTLPIKNHLYLSLDLPGCWTRVGRLCAVRFYRLSQIVVWIEGDFMPGPTDYRRWLVVGCNPFSPPLSKTPLGYARLPEDRQHGRWILLLPPSSAPPTAHPKHCWRPGTEVVKYPEYETTGTFVWWLSPHLVRIALRRVSHSVATFRATWNVFHIH